MSAVARGFGWVLMIIAALIVFIGALVVVEPLGFGAGPDFDPMALLVVVGIIVGSYSTIYIASPFLVVWQEWLGARAKKKTASEAPKVVAKKVRAGKA